VRQDFSTTFEDSIGSVFNHGRRVTISGREQNAIKIFAYPTGKYPLNELNLGPPGSGSISARYHTDPDPVLDPDVAPDPSIIKQKKVRKTLIPTVL
jgi:hypothetical protein